MQTSSDREGGSGAIAGDEAAPDRILRAAIECMRQFGSLKMSMADVAKAAGCSRATVYKYFGNRQDLIDAVVDRGRDAFFRDLDATMRSHSRLPDQMAAAVQIVMMYLHDDTNAPWAGLLDPLDQAIITREHGGELMDGLADLTTQVVRDAAARGEVRSDLEPAKVGEWFGRLLFSSHFTDPEPEQIARSQRMVRDLCALVAPER